MMRLAYSVHIFVFLLAICHAVIAEEPVATASGPVQGTDARDESAEVFKGVLHHRRNATAQREESTEACGEESSPSGGPVLESGDYSVIQSWSQEKMFN